MKIKKFIVHQLFGLYDYSLDFFTKRYVTIMHGINGVGKTTVLRIITSIIDGDYNYLYELPFLDATIVFDNNEEITVGKSNEDLSVYVSKRLNRFVPKREADLLKALQKEYIMLEDNEKAYYGILYYMLKKKKGDTKIYPVIVNGKPAETTRNIRSFLSPVRDYDSREYLRGLMRETENLEQELCRDLRKELSALRRRIHICTIQASRIYSKSVKVANTDMEEDITAVEETVEKNAEQLKAIIDQIKAVKDDISEELDSTYPDRLLKLYVSNNTLQYTEKGLLRRWEELELKRNTLIQVGLLQEERTYISSKEMLRREYPKEAFPALSLYIQDYIKKISAYDDIKEKLLLFMDIINNRNQFTNKKMMMDINEGVLFKSSNGERIPLNRLSSGEKNNFILFFDLIFMCEEGSVIFIDEPEISLHVMWQREFVDELLEICMINNMQAIIATHSPNIIGDHIDLMLELTDGGGTDE